MQINKCRKLVVNPRLDEFSAGIVVKIDENLVPAQQVGKKPGIGRIVLCALSLLGVIAV